MFSIFKPKKVVFREKNECNAITTQTLPYNETQTNSRYLVQDHQEGWNGFQVTDTTAGTTTDIRFAWVGNNVNRTATWDYADTGEFYECEQENFNKYRQRLHQDDNFVEQQLMMNRRHDLWHDQMEAQGTVTTADNMWLASGTAQDIDGTPFFMTSNTSWGMNPPWWSKHPCLVRPLFTLRKIKQKLRWKTRSLNERYLKLNRTGEEFQEQYAKRKSMKLLERWLEVDEFNKLMKRGELEIFAEDAVYIVKKNPTATVTKKTKDGKESQFCIITEEMGWAVGDVLLSKILLLKTDPKRFEKVAIRRS